jgi:citrate lyase beta subunit
LSHAGLMRSLLSCPANEPRKVARLSGSRADAVVLDLEDAVAQGEKVAARRSARGALPTLRNALRCVRVSAFETGLTLGRAKIVYDARAAGLAPPLDGPFLKVRDQALLEQDCVVSRSLGHRGRVCIHPEQVPVVNRIYGPDPNEVLFARKVVDAFAEAERAGSASIVVDGVFVDCPIVHKAERIIALADAIATRAPEQPGANVR